MVLLPSPCINLRVAAVAQFVVKRVLALRLHTQQWVTRFDVVLVTATFPLSSTERNRNIHMYVVCLLIFDLSMNA
jgi:hypothetical protein